MIIIQTQGYVLPQKFENIDHQLSSFRGLEKLASKGNQPGGVKGNVKIHRRKELENWLLLMRK